MKCPFCGSEMEHGYLYSSQAQGFPWYPEDTKPVRNLLDFRFKKKGAMMFGKAAFAPFEFDTLSMYICKKCKKGVADDLTEKQSLTKL